MASKTASMLISAFTETKHNLQLDKDKKTMADFHQTIKKRRIQVKGGEAQ